MVGAGPTVNEEKVRNLFLRVVGGIHLVLRIVMDVPGSASMLWMSLTPILPAQVIKHLEPMA